MINGKYDETMRIVLPDQEGETTPAPSKPKIKEKPKRENLIDEKLNDSERALYMQFMDSIYDAVLITDWAGNVIDVNNRASEFFRCHPEELCQSDIFKTFQSFDALMLDRIRGKLEKGGRFVLIEAYCRRIDGTIFPAEIASHKLELGKEEHMCFFIRDTTKRHEAEKALLATQERLAQAERLETAGRIAGLIAHDFNNLLTPLLGYPPLIKEHLPEGSEARADLDIIANTAQRMAQINNQLLTLSRRGQYDFSVVDINATIKHLIQLVRRSCKDKIEVKLELAADLLNVMGVEDQLLRVIQNLYQNAIDAMGETGTLIIKTENSYIEPGATKEFPAKNNEYVKIIISDTGHGIPAEIQTKIFEPFFTTRQSGVQRRGSGLGMSVVYGTIQEHKGVIELESEVGRGTIFTLYLPAERRNIEIKPSSDIIAKGDETIMVVDDDTIQVEVMSKILANLGYKVLSAKTGEETIDIVTTHKDTKNFPNLIVLDIIMGHGMDGMETYHKLKELNPNQKVMFISGRQISQRIQSNIAQWGTVLLNKPVSAEDLGMAIRIALDKQPVN